VIADITATRNHTSGGDRATYFFAGNSPIGRGKRFQPQTQQRWDISTKAAIGHL
jgi:hypothetical protein